jgi:hypothetical protein
MERKPVFSTEQQEDPSKGCISSWKPGRQEGERKKLLEIQQKLFISEAANSPNTKRASKGYSPEK